MSLIDASRVTALIAKAIKLAGSSPVSNFIINKDGVSIESRIESTGTVVFVKDKDAVLSYDKKSVKVGIPLEILKSALARRGKVDVTREENQLHLKASRFSASIVTQPELDVSIPKDINGIDAKPLQMLVDAVGSSLEITSIIDSSPVMVRVEWSKGRIRASAADSFHAVYVEGDCPSAVDKHSLLISSTEMKMLSQVGGAFELGDTYVAARSEDTYLRLQRSVPDTNVISLEMVQKLSNISGSAISWTSEVKTDEVSAALENVYAVLEFGKPLSVVLGKKTLTMKAASGYGEASVRVPSRIRVKSKKSMTDVKVNSSLFNEAVSVHSGDMSIALSGNILVFSPIDDGKKKSKGKKADGANWRVTSFASLIAGE